jgi:hypothetical protein
MAKLREHPRPWRVVDPNKGIRGQGYRPIYIYDASASRVLYVGSEPDARAVAEFIVAKVNKRSE